MTMGRRSFRQAVVLGFILALTLTVLMTGFLITGRLDRMRGEAQGLEEEARRLETALQRIARERSLLGDDSMSGLYWEITQAGQGTALVQSRLSQAASDAGIVLQSMAPVTEGQSGEETIWTFRLEGEAPLDRWLAFVVEIEQFVPLLAIDVAGLRYVPTVDRSEPQPNLYGQMDILAPVLLREPVAALPQAGGRKP